MSETDLQTDFSKIPVNWENRLKQALAKERMADSYELVKISVDFFDQTIPYIKAQPNAMQLTGLFHELYRLRRGKIVHMADSADDKALNLMAAAEQEYFTDLRKARSKYERKMTAEIDAE